MYIYNHFRSLDDNHKDCKHKEIAKRKKSECLLNINEKESCSTVIQHPVNSISDEPTYEKEPCSTIIQHPADNDVNKTPENDNIRDSREIHYGEFLKILVNLSKYHFTDYSLSKYHSTVYSSMCVY